MSIDWGSAFGKAVERAIVDRVGRAMPEVSPGEAARVVAWCCEATWEYDSTVLPQELAQRVYQDWLAACE